MITPRTPSILRIIWTDYYARLAAFFVFPILALVMIILGIPIMVESGLFFTNQQLLVVLLFLAFWIIVFGGWLALRISTIRSAFNDGQEVKGQITEVALTSNTGWVKYSYVYMGTPYTCSNRIAKNGRTRQLAAGSQALVMVDVGDPKRAFLRDLYL